MGVARGWLPQSAGSPIPVSGGDTAAVPPGGRVTVKVIIDNVFFLSTCQAPGVSETTYYRKLKLCKYAD